MNAFLQRTPLFCRLGQSNCRNAYHVAKPGDVTRIATPTPLMQFDTHLLENASFMRMKNLTVGYTLPPKVIQKTGVISNARIYFVGRNLLTVTKYKGYDPK